MRDKIECLKQSRLEKEKKESKKRGPPKTKQHSKQQQQQEQTEQTEQTEPESKRIKVEKSKEKEEISEKAPTPSVNDVISKYSIFPRLWIIVFNSERFVEVLRWIQVFVPR